jgi:hypothetical protein
LISSLRKQEFKYGNVKSSGIGGTMNRQQLEIARFLTRKALQHQRATYQQVGEAIAWSHPAGLGLGENLDSVQHYLLDRGLPPLTAIVVKKGHLHPSEDAMIHIRNALGDIDIEAAQKEVFSFDWTSVPELTPNTSNLPNGREVWLTSFWGFDPGRWGCIGFADEGRRNRFLRNSKPGTLIAIYVTKGKGAQDMRGKVVGVLEVSHEVGSAENYLSGDRWAEKENDPDARGKWSYAVRATRAWRIVPEDWKKVEELFPVAYRSAHPEFIGANGVHVEPSEASKIFGLDVYEVPVYGRTGPIEPTLQTLEAALVPSRAIPPASKPFWVGETDGPKYLYILKLTGDIAAYLGRSREAVEGKHIIKVGFSKSPLARRDQIQSSYPKGSFEWEVFRPAPQPKNAPYANARIAIAGEDAMKERLVDEQAEVLGGEFFLADDWLVQNAWGAGIFAATKAEESRCKEPSRDSQLAGDNLELQSGTVDG